MDYPHSWSVVPLEETCEIIMGQSPSSEYYNEEKVGLPFYQGKAEFGTLYPRPVKWCSKPQKIAEAGDILISVRAPVGPTNLCQEQSCIGRGLAALRSKEGNSSQYIFHFLRYIEKEWDSKATGTTFKAISGDVLRRQEIPLPPLPEQERIVARIEELFSRLDAGVKALKRAQAALKRYRASLLKAACEGRLVAQDPNDEPAEEMLRRIHPVGAQRRCAPTEDLPELPAGWCWATMQQLGTHRLGKMLDKEKNIGSPRPYLRNANVRWFTFDLDDLYEIKVTDEELENIVALKGDLIVCEGGEPGRAAVWESDEKIVIQKALHRIRPHSGILPKYIAFRLATDANTGVLEKYFTGSTIKHFTGESLRSYLLPLPPTNEQYRIIKEIERQLSLLQELEESIIATLTRAARLRQAILKRAFEGRLVGQESEMDTQVDNLSSPASWIQNKLNLDS